MGGVILLKPEEFVNGSMSIAAIDGSPAKTTFFFTNSVKIESSDVLVLQFEAYSESDAATLCVQCGTESKEIYLTNTPKAYYIPITGLNDLSKVGFELMNEFQDVYINTVWLVNYGNELSRDIELLLGSHTLNDYETVILDNDEKLFDRVDACVIDEKYVYFISRGTLSICTISDSRQVTEIGSVSGLGSTRDMAFTKDQKALVVTSRRNGVYIVDISDPTNPTVLSHYDSLEYSTGLDINGNYAFICSRWFGVEIVDISDLRNPQYVSSLNGENEYQDCFFDSGFVYVGVYNGKRIDVWDVRNITEAILVSQIELDGSGQGCVVKNGILYAATGLKGRNAGSSKYDYKRGVGSGLEIYDVSDPTSPKWLSTTKAEGRQDINLSDTWDVQVQGNRAYLSNMYGGVYIFDISYPKAPALMKKIDIVANRDSEDYSSYDLDSYIFPYDAENETHGCVSHVVLGNGIMYLTTTNMGLFRIADPILEAPGKNTEYVFDRSDFKKVVPDFSEFNAVLFESMDQVYAIKKFSKNYVVANGKRGLLLLDESFNMIFSFKTDAPVKDIEIYDDLLFAAESENGIGIYLVSDTKIERLGGYKDDLYDSCYGDIALTGDGSYVIAEAAYHRFSIIDVRDVYNPMVVDISKFGISDDVGMMYYRSICNGLIDGKYVAISGSDDTDYFYSDNGELRLYGQQENKLYYRSNGCTAINGGSIQIADNGYYYIDISNKVISEKIKIKGVNFEGKCIAKDNILVISSEYNGNIMIIDISDISNPVLIESVTINGNPDIAYIDGDSILIPCRYYGLLRLTHK